MSDTVTSNAAPASSPRAAATRLHRIVVVVLPAVILVQASLAGQHLFEGSGIKLHGILGNITFAITVVGLVLTVMRRTDGPAFAVAVALMALAFAQIGLGYVGRETTAAAAWHIPMGVTIFGLACYQLASLRRTAT